eukprot:TRINITY_DN8392_c0_g1_i1.p1 TRINITY_DN8392_c0_g1~~TRINITY_DN8392_c0_g1_i1.p1  ORF type:complete len:752 (+),score=175.58 TRINITY_DN8392_c0_g1_i1:67-2322(+)
MGAEVSTLPPKSDLPYPEAWAKFAGDAAAARGALAAISELDTAALLAATPPVPELRPDAWNFQEFMGCAQEALNIDARLQKRIDQIVPKRVLEDEFWRLYYCHAYDILNGGSTLSTTSAGSGSTPSPLNMALLKVSDDSTSNAIISAFKDDTTFRILSQKETDGILSRDAEDDEKLAAGIAKAVAKGVVEKSPPVEKTCKINVLGKSADVVAAEILRHLGDAPKTGCVLVLQGLSGTGKGTTVAKLQATLPRAACWSNGNVFRALTLLACAHCDKLGIPLSSEVLTAPLLEALMSCLKFGKFNGEFDINVKGHGYDVLVSEVANTVLKEPRVGKNIPTVAEVTQGEVIKFAAAAAEAMRADGMNVLMEGRAQTLDYIRTPHRFELTLPEPIIIGMRRAAQRMMGSALTGLKDASDPSAEAVHIALEESLAKMLGSSVPAAAFGQPISLSSAVLEAGDDTSTNSIIQAFREDSSFLLLSKREADGILRRDAEDDEKLAAGIAKAIAKGVVEAKPPVEATCNIDVLGKSADIVAAEIIKHLGDAPKTGCVLVLQGLSGTGKGTTVAKLQASLPRASCWSNGNVFRALTLLAVTHCEKQDVKLDAAALTPALLQELISCLEFGKFNGQFDIKVKGQGYDVLVSEVANTILKEPRVGKNIPTVAEVTQGEVIKFAAAAAEAMRADGMNVLMEGRAQTLNYIRTPHRFELTLPEPIIIGMRRAAQRMMGSALQKLKSQASAEDVRLSLLQAAKEML